jgi:hypothetical protein
LWLESDQSEKYLLFLNLKKDIDVFRTISRRG